MPEIIASATTVAVPDIDDVARFSTTAVDTIDATPVRADAPNLSTWPDDVTVAIPVSELVPSF
jgi:hypothetical protein